MVPWMILPHTIVQTVLLSFSGLYYKRGNIHPKRMKTFVLLLVTAVLVPQGSNARDLTLISDTHYDPLYGQAKGYGACTAPSPPLGRPGCDTPPGLLESLCTDIKNNARHHTILTGDVQRHKFNVSGLSISDTFGPICAKLNEALAVNEEKYPMVSVAIGNNDLVPNYYLNISEENKYLKQEADVMVSYKVLLETESNQFKKCGYYSRELSSKLRVIVLNTIAWCYCNQAHIPDTVKDPCGQMQFLRDQLRNAKGAGAKVIIISHVPPYINVWSVLKNKKFRSIDKDMYWKPWFQKEYNELMKDYETTVALQFFGHVHLFSLQALENGVKSIIIPAVTPVYSNHPNYLIATVDDTTMKPTTIRQRFLENGTWHEGTHLEDTFGNLSDSASLHKSIRQLLTDDESWNKFLNHRAGGRAVRPLFPHKVCDTWCRHVVVCSMFKSTYEEIQECVNPGKGNHDRSPRGLALVTLLLFVLFWRTLF
ncbi:hypothetical protein TRVL_05650 [Trypanosoma vivax]|uniref:Uncharacterized protein n=1 Tax=Trypanosoma vivax (strain Y486) TaxID=1055687 RepID=G0TTY6_TRYVY|nr:hypothetical protein TRVL_05650 [Trypanosoma vivax]CCC47419.1 conserved hypothetical protein [Trypanosoma vivax Y486]